MGVMSGMEMMLSNLIGMRPEELQASARQTIDAIKRAADNMEQINARLMRIEEALELNNGRLISDGRDTNLNGNAIHD